MIRSTFRGRRLNRVVSVLCFVAVLACATLLAGEGYNSRCLPLLKWHEEEYVYDSLQVLHALRHDRIGDAIRLSQRNMIHPMVPVWVLTGAMAAFGLEVPSFRLVFLGCYILTVLLVYVAGYFLVDKLGWVVGLVGASLLASSGRFCWMFPMGEHPDDLVAAPIFAAGILVNLAAIRLRSRWWRLAVGCIATLLFFTKYHFAILFMGVVLIDLLWCDRREKTLDRLQNLLWVLLVPACGIVYWITIPRAIDEFTVFITKSVWVDSSAQGLKDWYVQVRRGEPLLRYVKQLFVDHGSERDYFFSVWGNLLSLGAILSAAVMRKERSVSFLLLSVALPMIVLTLYPRKADEAFLIFSVPVFLLCGLVAHRAVRETARIRRRLAAALVILGIVWTLGLSVWRAFALPPARLEVQTEELRPFFRFAESQLDLTTLSQSATDRRERLLLCIDSQIQYDVDLIGAFFWNRVLEEGVLLDYDEVHGARINLREYLRRRPLKDLLSIVSSERDLRRIDAVWFRPALDEPALDGITQEMEEALVQVRNAFGPEEEKEAEYVFDSGEMSVDFVSLFRSRPPAGATPTVEESEPGGGRR